MTPMQAKTENNFHAYCILLMGPRGGLKFYIENWRRMGRTKLWKTRPDEFRIPIKHGMYGYGSYLTEKNCEHYHAESECEVLKQLRERSKSASCIGYRTVLGERTYTGNRILAECPPINEPERSGRWQS